MTESLNFNQYIGLPYWESDCWNLVKRVLKDLRGIELTDDFDEKLFREVDDPEPGDVLVFKREGFAAHIGIYAGRGLFLHSLDGVGAALSRLSSRPWLTTLDGAYRL